MTSIRRWLLGWLIAGLALAALTLAKGRYIVFCNEPGHDRDGMRTECVVGTSK